MIYEMVRKIIEELKQTNPDLPVSVVEHNDGALVELGHFNYDVVDLNNEVIYEVAQVQLMLPKPGVAALEIIAHFIELDGTGELSGNCWGSCTIDACNAHSLLEEIVDSSRDEESKESVSFTIGEARAFNQNSSIILSALSCSEVRELYWPVGVMK